MESRPGMCGVLFELPPVMPDELKLREQYLMPALGSLLERLKESGDYKLVDLELPKGVEHAEIMRDIAGLSTVRFTAAWTMVDEGTEDEPDWQLRHLGRIDVQIEQDVS